MLEPTIYCTPGEHANHYTTDAVLNILKQMTLVYIHVTDVHVSLFLEKSLKIAKGGNQNP
jgi:hypothetical protein